jgi:hypothetical protein
VQPKPIEKLKMIVIDDYARGPLAKAIIDELLDEGAESDILTLPQPVSLVNASGIGHQRLLGLILSTFPYINSASLYDALMEACKESQFESVQNIIHYAIAHNVHIKAKKPLHVAIQKDNLLICRILYELAFNEHRRQPIVGIEHLVMASKNGHSGVLEWVLSKRPKRTAGDEEAQLMYLNPALNDYGFSTAKRDRMKRVDMLGVALCVAAAEGHMGCVRAILEAGADPTWRKELALKTARATDPYSIGILSAAIKQWNSKNWFRRFTSKFSGQKSKDAEHTESVESALPSPSIMSPYLQSPISFNIPTSALASPTSTPTSPKTAPISATTSISEQPRIIVTPPSPGRPTINTATIDRSRTTEAETAAAKEDIDLRQESLSDNSAAPVVVETAMEPNSAIKILPTETEPDSSVTVSIAEREKPALAVGVPEKASKIDENIETVIVSSTPEWPQQQTGDAHPLVEIPSNDDDHERWRQTPSTMDSPTTAVDEDLDLINKSSIPDLKVVSEADEKGENNAMAEKDEKRNEEDDTDSVGGDACQALKHLLVSIICIINGKRAKRHYF